MESEIICVGTELLLGDQIDLNSSFIAQHLASLGIDVYYQSNVGDNSQRLQEIIKIALGRSQLIIITGGLGPTEDDLTKQSLAHLLNIKLLKNQDEVQRLKDFFAQRNQAIPVNNFRQALIPEGAKILKNRLGTASGLALEHNNKYFILLPGPPHEMQDIFLNEALPWLNRILKGSRNGIYSQTLKFIGITEASLEEKLSDLMHNQSNPTLALLAKSGEIHCRLTGKVTDQEAFLTMIEPLKKEILRRVGEYCYGINQQQLEEIIINKLRAQDLSIVTVESCTGGLIAQRMTGVPGSSQCFKAGLVTYTNETKNKLLGIPLEVLSTSGAISQVTATLMARNALEIFKVDLALAITGNAGPTASEKKPIGLIYIALAGVDFNIHQEFILSGSRKSIRWQSSNRALNFLRKKLDV